MLLHVLLGLIAVRFTCREVGRQEDVDALARRAVRAVEVAELRVDPL